MRISQTYYLKSKTNNLLIKNIFNLFMRKIFFIIFLDIRELQITLYMYTAT